MWLGTSVCGAPDVHGGGSGLGAESSILAAMRGEDYLSDRTLKCLDEQSIDATLQVDAIAGVWDPVLEEAVGVEVHRHPDLAAAVDAVRGERMTVLVVDRAPDAALRRLGGTPPSVPVVLVGAPDQALPPGVMAVVQSMDGLMAQLSRAFLYRALYLLELAHRCEARRLSTRSQALVGAQATELSDDLSSAQPPSLPVGLMSELHLDSAADAFERAYIERVQALSSSAREAAEALEVSTTTLARRLRREDGE